jgi:heme/copper-type cytochrome/quinol oxidase subunit 1
VGGLLGFSYSLLIRLNFLVSLFIGEGVVYSSILTLHGILMIFFLVMPSLLGGFGNFLVAPSVGAAEISFPRLNSLSF